MNLQKINLSKIAPVLMAFFVMSFVDLVGIRSRPCEYGYGPQFNPGAVYPVGCISLVCLLLWYLWVSYSHVWVSVLCSISVWESQLGTSGPIFLLFIRNGSCRFSLLGIGNTIVQVSANPLLVDVVPGTEHQAI